MSNFNLYSQYYNLFYADKNYPSEVAYIDGLIKQHRPSSKRLLELGSGTGKHARLLAGKGYSVHGIERSPEMVSIAEGEPTENVSYQVADISSFTVPQKFDATLSLFHVISYLTTNVLLKNTFANASRHLADNGLFIFDVWHSPAVYVQKPQTRIKRLHNADVTVTRLAEPVVNYNDNTVDVHYEILIEDLKTNRLSTIREVHPMRHFSKPEIEMLANACGFALVKSEEFLTGKSPGPDTWGVCYILEKTGNA